MPNAGDNTDGRGLRYDFFLCPGVFGDAEEVTISGIGDGHDTGTSHLFSTKS